MGRPRFFWFGPPLYGQPTSLLKEGRRAVRSLALAVAACRARDLSFYPVYSYLSATIGSTRIALRVGTTHPITAANSTIIVPANTARSGLLLRQWSSGADSPGPE